MPITQSAKKALRGSLKKKAVNDRRNKTMKDAVKKVEKLVKTKDTPSTKAELSLAYKAIDKAAKTGIIKKNTASRKKSRLARITKVK
jgi:small subunit ribosomal protein S20